MQPPEGLVHHPGRCAHAHTTDLIIHGILYPWVPGIDPTQIQRPHCSYSVLSSGKCTGNLGSKEQKQINSLCTSKAGDILDVAFSRNLTEVKFTFSKRRTPPPQKKNFVHESLCLNLIFFFHKAIHLFFSLQIKQKMQHY